MPICMHHHYMCIVMEIVLRWWLPPGAELLAMLEDRQARIFRTRIFVFICVCVCACAHIRAEQTDLRVGCDF